MTNTASPLTHEQLTEMLQNLTPEQLAKVLATATTPEEKKPALTADNTQAFINDVLALASAYGFNDLNIKHDAEKNNGKPYANLYIGSAPKVPATIGEGEDAHTCVRYSVNITMFDWDVKPDEKLSKSAQKMLKASGKTGAELEKLKKNLADLGLLA